MMKKTGFFLTALLCVAAAAHAMEMDGRRIATLDIANADGVPHSVVIDQGNNTIRVLAGPGGSAIQPGQDIAMRVEHGQWRIVGDTGREMRVRFHHGQDYRLQLRPYVYGDEKMLVGELDDGYSHWNEALADLGRLPRVGEPPHIIEPQHHRHHHDEGNRYPDWDKRNQQEEAGRELGEAVADAFDAMLFHHQPEPAPHHGHRR